MSVVIVTQHVVNAWQIKEDKGDAAEWSIPTAKQ